MPFTDAPGHRTHYEEGGSGPTLVLLHGWMGSSLLWPRQWLERLESQYRVLRIDHRGAGGSDAPGGAFDLHDLARDIVAVLDAFDVDTAHVAGLSMGGMVSQVLAAHHPDRVDRLVLIATAPLGGTEATHPDLVPALASALGGGDLSAVPHTVAQLAFATGWFDRVDHVILGELAEAWQAAPLATETIGLQVAAATAWDGRDRLGAIASPTLVLHGDDDRILHVDNAQVLAEGIADVRSIVYPGVGHMLPWEQPDSAEAIVEFLAEGGG